MNKGYRSLIIFMFILFEIVYVISILANITTVPAYIEQNGEMILMAAMVFNVLILSSMMF